MGRGESSRSVHGEVKGGGNKCSFLTFQGRMDRVVYEEVSVGAGEITLAHVTSKQLEQLGWNSSSYALFSPLTAGHSVFSSS